MPTVALPPAINFYQLGFEYVALLTGVVVFLVATRRIASDVRPIFVNVINGVATSAGSNATAYAIAIMFGLSASMSAFYDVFNSLDAQTLRLMSFHQYFALWAKVLNPFIVAVLAYATQNKFKAGGVPIDSIPTPAPAVALTPGPVLEQNSHDPKLDHEK